ncbi:MAG: ferritin-like fold-containing protein [Candidatus Nanopelagicales bacterium]
MVAYPSPGRDPLDDVEPEQSVDRLNDPQYREAVVELLGLLACGEFLAFERLVSEGLLAPRLAQRVRISKIAAGELAHSELLRERITQLGANAEAVMAIFADPLEHFHQVTTPSDWLEGLVKAYVGDSIATDFYREISTRLDAATGELVGEVCAELGQTEIVLEEVRAAIAVDPRVAGRLALWGRRLLGEALTHAQNVAAQREPLLLLVLGDIDHPGIPLADLATMTDKLTAAHVARMTALGLSA